MPHNTPGIELDEATEISWTVFLRDFEEQVWPIFEKRGYSRDTALMIWKLNIMENEIENLVGMFSDDD